MKYYNPYHFVPVGGQRQGDLQRDAFAGGDCRTVRHDLYVEGTRSGRLLCRLTTVTETVVGSQQTRDAGGLAQVEPFRKDGLPAIPGSTLRGLISAVAEAASNSALRVLDATPYSVRRTFNSPELTLSAIGMVRIEPTTGRYILVPLCIPTLKRVNGKFVLPRNYQHLFPRPLLKIHVGGRGDIRRSAFPYRTWLPGQGPVRTVSVIEYSWQKDLQGSYILTPEEGLYERDGFLLASKEDPQGTVRMPVIARVLGCWGDREPHIPPTKKHELLLPFPDSVQQGTAPAVYLPQAVVDRFHALADERTEASLKVRQREPNHPLLPFEPKDTRPGRTGNFRLQEGDLVYFRTDRAGEIAEVALAGIWRGRVLNNEGQPSSAHDFFTALDPNLVPFGPKRTLITVAEQMFGFVEEAQHSERNRRGTLALASRIRVSDAELQVPTIGEQALSRDWVPLKILSSPKPPCPSMYFCGPQGDTWVDRNSLDPGSHSPQGRKFYLHHRVKPGDQPWKTADPKENASQKVEVQPILPKTAFLFELDFDNLSEPEFYLLLYSLSPDAAFHHKLGLGKPLGLGTVKIEILAFGEVDRSSRYTPEGLGVRRYRRAYLVGTQDSQTVTAVLAYREEAQSEEELEELLDNARRIALQQGIVTRAAHHALLLLGDPNKIAAGAPVETPRIEDQLPERETFRWFVANDLGTRDRENNRRIRPQRTFLPPLDENRKDLPTLPAFRWEAER